MKGKKRAAAHLFAQSAHVSNAGFISSSARILSNPLDCQFNYGSLIPDHAQERTIEGCRNKELNVTKNLLSASDNLLSWRRDGHANGTRLIILN